MAYARFEKAHLLGVECPAPVTDTFLRDKILNRQIYFRYFVDNFKIIDLIL